MILPFLIVDSGSIPQTFSPIVEIIPEIAAPMARPSQLFFAMFVDPSPGITTGIFTLIPLSCPNFCSILTFSKRAMSESASIPCAPLQVPSIVKCDKSTGYSFSPAEEIIPKGWG
ncbi:hypothetical protein ES708_30913 [subsurface metagenome]